MVVLLFDYKGKYVQPKACAQITEVCTYFTYSGNFISLQLEIKSNDKPDETRTSRPFEGHL